MATENIKKMPAVKVVFNPYKNVQGKSTEGKLDRKNSTGNTISGVTTDSEILSIDIEKAVKEARKNNTKWRQKIRWEKWKNRVGLETRISTEKWLPACKRIGIWLLYFLPPVLSFVGNQFI